MDIAQSRARIIEAIASEELKQNHKAGKSGDILRTFTRTMSILHSAHMKFEGFGETGEFSMAKRAGDEIFFILDQRHGISQEPLPVKFNSSLAEPMRRALTEKKGGVLTGIDYRGVEVVAAYEPVDVLNMGIVAKIDLAEVRWPYLRIGIITALICIMVIITGAAYIVMFGNSIINYLHGLNDELHTSNGELEQMNEEFMSTNEELETTLEDLSESQKELEKSLYDKETLLRELYHRTKNNMQIICSLLNLQAYEARDNQELVDALQETENRILSMSLVHQKLYQSHNLSNISLKDYIHNLCDNLRNSFDVSENRIKHHYNLEEIHIPIDIAVPLGLILNELISNSFKHGFPEKRSGAITIESQKNNNEVQIFYSDDGVGLPSDYNFYQPISLGSQLILNIVNNQLKGSIDVVNGKGFNCSIKFSIRNNS